MTHDLPPHMMRRTMVKPTVGHVRRSTYDLPDAKNPNHVYGLALPRDPEDAGAVIGMWVAATPSPAAKCDRSFIETNKQAIHAGSGATAVCITAGEARQYALEHPEILVKTPEKRKVGYTPSKDTVYGIKSKQSEDINALVQARFTTFSPETDDYPDLSNMKIKGKLPPPRETKTSILKDARLNPRPKEKDPSELFKMSKFKKVGSMLCTQPGASAGDELSIRCLVGGVEQRLPLERVNDDYCDCDDGKDEHGTTACSHLLTSTFYCENGGYFTKQIPTSLLNDGICDCCDGSDEFDTAAGAAACDNTCAQDAVAFREKARERLKQVEIGFKKRKEALEGVVAAHFDGAEGSEATIAQSLASLKALKERVEVYKVREERRERKMRLEEARKKQPIDPSEATTADDPEKLVDSGCVPNSESGETCVDPTAPTDGGEVFEGVDAVDVKAELLETEDAATTDEANAEETSDDAAAHVRRVRSMIELSDGTKVSLSDYMRMQHQAPRKTLKGSRSADEMRRQDFLGPLFNGKEEDRKRIGLYALRGLGLLLSPARLAAEIVLYVPRLLGDIAGSSEMLAPYVQQLPSLHTITDSPSFRRLGGGTVYRTYRDVAWGTGVIWDAPVYVYNYLYPHVDDQLTLPEAESLRQVLREIEDDIRKLESERETQQRDLSFDYGPDRAFYALKNECIEKTVEKYVYKLCPFNNVQQDFTSLGRWEAWGVRDAADDAKDYGVMRFTQGQRCWNGPERSVRVTWRCGETNEILSVEEPSTCVYEMAAESYLACTADVVASAKQDVAFWG
ncbi:hypothetical protein ATCC90586_001532 [Pythium insidiosum]|nr:hypothetical protein ATCC90586_001532 [Pythium insidiosum]